MMLTQENGIMVLDWGRIEARGRCLKTVHTPSSKMRQQLRGRPECQNRAADAVPVQELIVPCHATCS